MYQMNDDMSIFVTRGDCCSFPIPGEFKPGDVVRFKVFRKKDCASVVMQRDFTIETAVDTVEIALTGEDTKIGEVISKPTDYWYEVELNPDTYPQTIRGYDEDGAKIFRLYPEGKDVDADDIEVVGKKTLQELVDYALEQAKESGEFDGKDGVDGKDGYTPVKGKDYLTEEEKAEFAEEAAEKAEQSCSNALKATASGEVVRVDDVSPFEHTAKARVRGKNLIPYPYYTDTVTGGGVTFTAQADGGITATGTATAQQNFTVYYDKMLTDGVITASLSGEYTNLVGVFVLRDEAGTPIYNKNVDPAITVDVSQYPAAVKMEFLIKRKSNVAVSGTVYPQIEIGDTATAFEPYIDPTTVEVIRCGKNLVPYPFYSKTKTENGITFTDTGNGIISVSGTATDNAFFHFVIDSKIRVKGEYTLSGLTGGSGTTYYIQPFISGNAVRGLTNGSQLYDFDGVLDKITMVVTKGTTIDYLKVKLQLEQGNSATAFEPYQVEEYTPTADGTCDIVPVSPTMTLFADTPGVNIEVEYSQDTNKAMQNVHSELQELDRVTGNLITEVGDIETALDGIIAIQNGLLGGDAV